MKIIINILLVFVSTIANAQMSYLNYTKGEVIEVFKGGKDYNVGNTKADNVEYVAVSDAEQHFICYFNNDDLCFAVNIIPFKRDRMNEIIATYNKSFVIINDKSWIKYIDGFTLEISLEYNKEKDIYYFNWTLK